VARGRATFPSNSCKPSCANGKITDYPVSLRLSRPRLCNRHYQYRKLTYTFLAGPSKGRSETTGFGFVCE
jgi:hypothetical protein